MVELFVCTNASVGVPKVWAFENVPGGCNIFFGSINKSWTKQVKKAGYAIDKQREKLNDGYFPVGSFASIQDAENFRDAYNESVTKPAGYQFDNSDANQRNFAQSLSKMGYKTRNLGTMPQPQSQPVQSAPVSAPAPAAPIPRPAPSTPAVSLASVKFDGDDDVCLL